MHSCVMCVLFEGAATSLSRCSAPLPRLPGETIRSGSETRLASLGARIGKPSAKCGCRQTAESSGDLKNEKPSRNRNAR